ncbi:MAG: phosphotransferase [Caldilineaceae bacterium]
MRQLIPPLATQNGQLWMALDSYQIIAYPFVPGQTGYTHGMTTAHWADFGSAIHQLHATTLPAHLASVIPHEDFAPIWPERMRTLLQSAPANADEPVVQALVHFLLEKINELSELIDFTERLADTLRSSPLAFVLCHGDMHGWNLLIDNDDRLFIVDWDTLILAPKETRLDVHRRRTR